MVKNDLSPLGCKVPSLPDFMVDPSQSIVRPRQQYHWECIASIIIAMLVGTVWALVSFSEWGQNIYGKAVEWIGG